MQQQSLVCIGAAVMDHRIEQAPATATGKQECRIQDSLGGGAIVAARQAQAGGISVGVVALVGVDSAAATVTRLVRDEFPQAAVLRGMEFTRQSILEGDRCRTQRSAVTLTTLPLPVRQQIAAARMTVIGPFAAADTVFVRHLLEISPKPVLVLSKSQLATRDLAAELARKAYCVVVNHEELKMWTGEMKSIEDGLRYLQEQFELQRVIITSPRGATGFIEQKWISQASPRVETVYRTIGAGDTFVGELAASLVQDLPWNVAVAKALHAAAQFVQTPELPRPATTTLDKPRDLYPIMDFGWRLRIPAGLVAAAMLVGFGLGRFI